VVLVQVEGLEVMFEPTVKDMPGTGRDVKEVRLTMESRVNGITGTLSNREEAMIRDTLVVVVQILHVRSLVMLNTKMCLLGSEKSTNNGVCLGKLNHGRRKQKEHM
jgi:hypothetical protein